MTLSIPTYENFTECYYDLTREVMLNPDYECAPRGQAIREKIGVSFKIKDPRNRLPYIPERNYSLSYMCAEAAWYFAGRNDVAWIANYSPFWLDVTDDGKTANSSYGSRIYKEHDRIDNGSHVQYQRVLNELKNDKDTRRAVIYLTQPSDHHRAKLDIGCALNLQAFVRNNRLHLIANMRSSDLILGIPYDVSAFTLVQEMLANDLGVELGEYTHHSNSLHVYERNFEVAEAVCNATVTSDCPPMPQMPIHTATLKLLSLEEDCRKATSGPELRSIHEKIPSLFEDEYWRDWAAVFVQHKAKKLDKSFKLELQKSYSFEGYRRFKK
jgi:thymidylate synthase